MDALTDLQKALHDGAWNEALSLALTLWRTTRQARARALVFAMHERAAKGWTAPKARGSAPFHEAWMAIAHDDPSAVATGWLAGTLDKRVPTRPRPDAAWGSLHFHVAKNAPQLDRVRRLAARNPDPRIAEAALAALAKGRLGGENEEETEALYQPYFDLVLGAADPAVVPQLRAIAANPQSRRGLTRALLARRVPALADELAGITTAGNTAADIPSDTLAFVDPFLPRAAPQAPREDVAQLWAHVLAHPEQAEARAVLADAWIQHGDDRGKLLLLERNGAGPKDKRVRKLVRANKARWMGDALASATKDNVVFRGGVLEEIEMRKNVSVSATTFEEATRCPELATVTVLREGEVGIQRYEALLGSPHLRSLRRVEVSELTMLEVLAQRPECTLEELILREPLAREHMALIGSAHALSRVHTLQVVAVTEPDTLLDDLRSAGLESRFREFQCFYYGDTFPRLIGLLREVPSLQRLRFGNPYVRLYLTLEVGAGGRWTLHLQWPAESQHDGGLLMHNVDNACGAMGAIPPELETVLVRGPMPDARLADLATRFHPVPVRRG